MRNGGVSERPEVVVRRGEGRPAGEVDAVVYDALGRTAARSREAVGADWTPLRLGGGDWPAGVYTVLLREGGEEATVRVAVR